MRKLSLATLTAAAVIGFGAAAFATPVNGSLTISTAGPTDAGPLNTRTVFDQPNPSNIGNSVTGDFVGFVTPGQSGALSGFNTADGTSLAALFPTFSFASTTVSLIGVATPGAVAYLFTGTLTPTGTFATAGFTATAASLRISLTRSGTSTSESVTLSAPPETIRVPEPASMALLGLGLAGIGFVRRKRA